MDNKYRNYRNEIKLETEKSKPTSDLIVYLTFPTLQYSGESFAH